MAKRRRKKKKKKKNKYEGKGGERLLRLIILVGVGFLILTVAKSLARRPDSSLSLPKLNLPKLSSQDLPAEEILGKVLSEIDLEKKIQDEPIGEPVEGIQLRTQDLVDSIKSLPQDQLEAVKKQIFKEICQDYCRETATKEENDITELPPED